MSDTERSHFRRPTNSECTNRRSRVGTPPYRRPQLVHHGPLGPLIRGASWKGIDSIGEIDPDEAYPG